MSSIPEVNESNWEKEVSPSDRLTVVYFWHKQCPWCFQLNPIFNEIAADYEGRVKFAKLNVLVSSTNQEMATNLGVMSTPTLMFFCNGRSVGQAVGLMSKEDLNRILNDVLGRYRKCIAQSTDFRDYIV